MTIKDIATKIVATLQQKGYTTYFAGGWVRDTLLGIASDDIDIATTATTDEVAALFPKTIPVGIAFGILIVVEEGYHFEVATFRKEKDYVDGRRPSLIEQADPEEDARRRDFTINGLFFDPITNALFDYVGGRGDIDAKVIRAIGDPHARFLEDRLRMIRAVRYHAKLGFVIEKKTEEGIVAHANTLFPSVAIERIVQELRKMARDLTQFAVAVDKLYMLHLLQTIFPRQLQAPPKTSFFPHLPPNTPFIFLLLLLFPEDALQEHLALGEYLKLSRQEQDAILFFHYSKDMLSMPESWQEQIENKELVSFYANPLSSYTLSFFNAPPFHKKKQKDLVSYIVRAKNKKTILQAKDLIEEGIPPSKELGELLRYADKLSANLMIEDKNTLLSLIKKNPLFEICEAKKADNERAN